MAGIYVTVQMFSLIFTFYSLVVFVLFTEANANNCMTSNKTSIRQG